jgi:hypothetical protein
MQTMWKGYIFQEYDDFFGYCAPCAEIISKHKNIALDRSYSGTQKGFFMQFILKMLFVIT